MLKVMGEVKLDGHSRCSNLFTINFKSSFAVDFSPSLAAINRCFCWSSINPSDAMETHIQLHVILPP